MSEKKKVVSLVLNSVLHDARVLKQAETLSQNDYEVTVIGIKDNKNNFDLKQLNQHLNIKLVAWKYLLHGYAASILKKAMLTLALVSVIAGVALFNSISNFEFSSFSEFSIKSFFAFIIALTFIAILLLIIYKKVHPLFSAQQRFKNNYGAMENALSNKKKSLFDSLIHSKLERVKRDAISEAIVSEAPDILHCHDVHGIEIAEYVKRQTGCKVVFDAHEIYEEVAQGNTQQKRENQKLQSVAASVADAFVTINESIAEFYNSKYADLPKAVIIKNACKFSDAPDYDGRLHEAAGLPLDKNILLYQGGFALKRGLFDLLKVGKYLPDNWSLVFMGWGSAESALRKTLAEERVTFLNLQNRDNTKTIVQQERLRLLKEVKIEAMEVSIQDKRNKQIDELATQPTEIVEDSSEVKLFSKKVLKDKLKEINAHVESISDIEKQISKVKRDLADFDKVIFIDKAPQSELSQWTAGARIGVIPYENIGLNHFYCTPNKLWEYPSAGVPSLISPFPEMEKVVIENDTGWVLDEPINPRKLAAFIAELTEDELNNKKQNCFKFIQQDNWSKYGEELLKLYKSL